MKLVKILRPVGVYQAGQVIEVSEETAENLCRASNPRAEIFDPEKEKKIVAEGLDSLTQKDMTDLGVKNIQSPPVSQDKSEEKSETMSQEEAQVAVEAGVAEIPEEAVVEKPSKKKGK